MAKKQNPKANNNLTKRMPIPNVVKRSLNNKTYKKPTTDRSMPSIPNIDKKSYDKELKLITTKWTDWISKQTEFERIDNKTIQVLTSFTDAFGDGILFNIISNADGTYTVTDNGYTIWNLETNGINVSKKGSNLNRILNSIVNPYRFSVSTNKNIKKEALNIDELPQTITDFVQVLINVSDIAFMNRTNTASIFIDDAHNYFLNRKEEYNFFTNSITLGKTNQQYRFDFNFMPKRQEFKLTKMYNTLSKNTMEAIIGIYSDTIDYISDNFGQNASVNILVNGVTAKEKDYISELQSHNINVVDFQNKPEVKKSFASIIALLVCPNPDDVKSW